MHPDNSTLNTAEDQELLTARREEAISALMNFRPTTTREQAESVVDGLSEDVKERPELPHVITLEESFNLGSEEKTTITFRNRLQGGFLTHLTVGKDQKFGEFFPIISKMTGETLTTIEKLGFTDLQECISVVSSFFKSGRAKTGVHSK